MQTFIASARFVLKALLAHYHEHQSFTGERASISLEQAPEANHEIKIFSDHFLSCDVIILKSLKFSEPNQGLKMFEMFFQLFRLRAANKT